MTRVNKKTMRLDQMVVQRGLADSRSRAQALILAGRVTVDGKLAQRAGLAVDERAQIEVRGDPNPYVSRGGLKLAHALKGFELDPQGWTVVDIGASTGGFTDCWLQAGAFRVYAVDVGYGQLAWKLRQNPKVAVFERTNGRWLTLAQLDRSQPVDVGSVDASFIGLKLLLGPLRSIVKAEGKLVALVKPQFEAGPKALSKGGVVRDRRVHREVLQRVIGEAASLGWFVERLTPSPIRGPRGNLEFFALLGAERLAAVTVEAVVEEAWQMEDGRNG